MNVRLELEVPLGSCASNWSQESIIRVLQQLKRKAYWKLLSITEITLV